MVKILRHGIRINNKNTDEKYDTDDVPCLIILYIFI